ALVRAIVEDVRDQPGALPLLQYALTELFERRDGPILTMSSYNDIGGAMGALARRAEDLFADLNPLDQATSRQLFLRLVTLGEGTEDTRRRVLRSELISLTGDDESMERTVNRFSRYRLITLDRDAATREPTVEIAHESLIREWSKLRDWLNTGREDLRMQRRVLGAAEDWEHNDRDLSYLARGAQLDTFEDWVNATDLELTTRERAYIDSSIEQREAVKQREAAQAAREAELEARSRTILRALVAVLIVALGVSVALSVIAFREREAAQVAAIAADRAAAVSQSASLASQSRLALLNGDIDLAVTLALEAASIDTPPPIARNMLFDIAYNPGTSHKLSTGDVIVEAVAVLPDEAETVVYGSRDGTLGVWIPTTGEQRTITATGEEAVGAVAADPLNPSTIAVGRADGTITVYNVESGEALQTFETVVGDARPVAVTTLDYTGEPDVVVAGFRDGNIRRIELSSGNPPLVFGDENDETTRHSGAVTSISLAGDGRIMMTTSVDRTARVWNLTNGELLSRFEGHDAPIRDGKLVEDGARAVTVSQDGEVLLWP
ncbi:MAG: hypothetical protein AAF125_20190, partial [Chloroflexota bacterium]